MRITIVKNDAFETVGLHVETTTPGNIPGRIFSWGVVASSFHFSKVVDGERYEREVFALVKAEFELTHANSLKNIVHDAIQDAGIKVQSKDGVLGLGRTDYYDGIMDKAKKNFERRLKELEEAIACKK